VRRAAPAFFVDAAFVLLFAALGRASHSEGVSWSGVVGVAWPFLVALALGWAVAHRRRASSWLSTVCSRPCFSVETRA